MRIVSLNAWGGRLYEAMVSYLAACDPDILCLQEVVRTPDCSLPWLDYRDDGAMLPQRANLFDDIAAALPGHDPFFCQAGQGNLFDGETPVLSQWGLATFVRRRFPVIGQRQDFIHGSFLAQGWGEHPRARNVHALRLYDEAAGRPMTIAHLHGLRDPAGKGDTPARERQAETLAGIIAGVWREGEPLVVCGDFNVLPQSVTFEVLRTLGLSDLVTAHGHTDTRTSHYRKSPRFADYMLVNDAVEVRSFEVVAEPEISDHRALLLETR